MPPKRAKFSKNPINWAAEKRPFLYKDAGRMGAFAEISRSKNSTNAKIAAVNAARITGERQPAEGLYQSIGKKPESHHAKQMPDDVHAAAFSRNAAEDSVS